MKPEELVRFLNTLRHFVNGFWRGKIDEVIQKMGGQVK